MKNLPKVRVEELERMYRSAKGKGESRRYHALWLLAKGYKRPQVQDIIGVSKTRLGDWVTCYKRFGLKALKNKPQPGNHRYLTNKQKTELKELVIKKSPQDSGYDSKYWTMGLLKRLVEDRYSVKYKSDTSYRNLFKWFDFTYHKPNKVNKKRDPHMVKRFEDKLKKSSGNTREKMVWYW